MKAGGLTGSLFLPCIKERGEQLCYQYGQYALVQKYKLPELKSNA